jgi:DNA-binding XRE family transcriptional regulator
LSLLQKDVATTVGVPQPTLCHYEKGLRCPSVASCVGLRAALRMDYEEFFEFMTMVADAASAAGRR